MAGDRQNSVRITAKVDGVDLGIFEDRSGGESDSDGQPYQLGGLGGPRALGGAPVFSNLIIKRLMDDQARGYIKWLRGRAGKGQMVVTELPINDDGEAIGEPEVWTGELKRVAPPDRSAESSTGAQLDLEMIVEAVA